MSRRSLEHTLELLKALDDAVTVEEIAATLLSKLRGFGVEAIIASLLPGAAHLTRFDRRLVVMLKVSEEWQRRYLAQGYAKHDPIVRETLQRPTGFAWHEIAGTHPRAARGRRVMDEAAEFGLADGYTVPITTLEGAQGGVSFAGKRLEIAPEHRAILNLVANYAFGHSLLIRDAAKPPAATLSPREREALQWAAEGKTDWEIGAIMNISAHGADRHLRNVRTKLAARNRAQSVAEGLRLGLIE